MRNTVLIDLLPNVPSFEDNIWDLPLTSSTILNRAMRRFKQRKATVKTDILS